MHNCWQHKGLAVVHIRAHILESLSQRWLINFFSQWSASDVRDLLNGTCAVTPAAIYSDWCWFKIQSRCMLMWHLSRVNAAAEKVSRLWKPQSTAILSVCCGSWLLFPFSQDPHQSSQFAVDCGFSRLSLLWIVALVVSVCCGLWLWLPSFSSTQHSWPQEFISRPVEAKTLQLPIVGWEGSMRSCFPTPVHTVFHTGAVLLSASTPAATLRLQGISVIE